MATLPVIDKYTGERIGEVPIASADNVDRAVRDAAQAFPAWSQTPAHERSRVLRRAAELIESQRERLTTTIAREAGKAWKHAAGEVARSVETFTFAAEEAKRIHGETVPMDASPSGEGRVGFYLRAPLGVVAAITPFNFPLNLVAHKVAPALAAGNTLVLKPAEETPLTAVAAGGDPRRGRACRTASCELVHGDGADDGRGARAPSGAGQGLVHWQPAGRRAHPASRRSQARHPRARQQLRHDRRARRQPRPAPSRGA